MFRGREKSRRCSRRPRSERYDTLDIVVANAGLQRAAPVDEMTVSVCVREPILVLDSRLQVIAAMGRSAVQGRDHED